MTAELTSQNAGNILLAAATMLRADFSPQLLSDLVEKIAAEGTPQEVKVLLLQANFQTC